MLSRRAFLAKGLRSSALISLAHTAPGFLTQTARAMKPDRDGRILVVIQLDGGNDGINTVVPFADEGYAKHRREIRLPADRLIKVGEGIGLHPSLKAAAELLQGRRLAIVQGVGYPNPDRSHFRSMAIWHTAQPDVSEQTGAGWLGRGLDAGAKPKPGAPSALLVGPGRPPVALRGEKSVTAAVDRLEDFTLAPAARPPAGVGRLGAPNKLATFVEQSLLDAYANAELIRKLGRADRGGPRYPETRLGTRLGLVARLIKAGFGARAYYTLQPGYDTHSFQLADHAALLAEFGGALRAFLDDLAASHLADRVSVLAFSEFGRTVKENASYGTDHGTAGPVFLAGSELKAGFVGDAPKLLDLDPKHGELKVGIDFRRVYATVLEDWLGLPARSALGGAFEPLPLFRS
jgi:uncharacterized protein (DUF1501 family)